MPLQRLIGNEWSTVPNSSRLADYYGANKYTVLETGVVKILKNYSITSGELKVAAHLDNGSDHPGALLASNDVGAACTGSSWNDIPIDDFAVTQNDLVWLGGNCDTTGTLSSSAGGTLKYVQATYETWAASDPSVNLPNTYGHTAGIQAWGYVPPSITSINSGSPINPGGSLSCAGSDFETSQGTGKFELCNNISYDSATIKVEQTISTWVDDTITGTVVQGTLSYGTVYAFVTTDSGQRNAVGFAVTLSASENACSFNGYSPASQISASASMANEATCNISSPASEISADASMSNDASLSVLSPASEISASVTMENSAVADFESPASEFGVSADMFNAGSIEMESPANEFDADGVMLNEISAAIQSPANEIDIYAAMSNAIDIAIESPAHEFHANATELQENACVVSILSPASEFHAEAIQENVGIVAIESPASEFDAEVTQENTCSIDVESPADVFDAEAIQENACSVDVESPASEINMSATTTNVNECSFVVQSPASEIEASLVMSNDALIDVQMPCSEIHAECVIVTAPMIKTLNLISKIGTRIEAVSKIETRIEEVSKISTKMYLTSKIYLEESM